MARFFNTAGPCEEARHYMVPPLGRLPEAMRLVERGHYFALHAPRQKGKTTFLCSFAGHLTASGRYVALHFSCETGEVADGDYEHAQVAMLNAMSRAASVHLEPSRRPTELDLPKDKAESALSFALHAWAAQQDKGGALRAQSQYCAAMRPQGLSAALEDAGGVGPRQHRDA